MILWACQHELPPPLEHNYWPCAYRDSYTSVVLELPVFNQYARGSYVTSRNLQRVKTSSVAVCCRTIFYSQILEIPGQKFHRFFVRYHFRSRKYPRSTAQLMSAQPSSLLESGAFFWSTGVHSDLQRGYQTQKPKKCRVVLFEINRS